MTALNLPLNSIHAPVKLDSFRELYTLNFNMVQWFIGSL